MQEGRDEQAEAVAKLVGFANQLINEQSEVAAEVADEVGFSVDEFSERLSSVTPSRNLSIQDEKALIDAREFVARIFRNNAMSAIDALDEINSTKSDFYDDLSKVADLLDVPHTDTVKMMDGAPING